MSAAAVTYYFMVMILEKPAVFPQAYRESPNSWEFLAQTEPAGYFENETTSS